VNHRIGSLAELRKGKPLGVTVDGRTVAVFDVNGEVIAADGKCPHAGGPLCKGRLSGATITCAWHGWSYDLITGECDEDPTLSLARYPVRIEGDDIFIEL
jgi:nitrite reductase (NADH) small subunit